MTQYSVTGVRGLPEVSPGDDLADLIAGSDADLRDGDIVVVTSKIVSKAEGRVRTGVDRDDAIDAETARVVSEWTTPRGRTRIAETPHGFVLAAAGVDASNVAPGTVVLLPEDPDGSARRLRRDLLDRLGVTVGVVITDTAGRPWRDGLVDFAVGAAGVVARDDLRGQTDGYGNELGVTVVAVADELASATELVRTKLAAMPVAVVRGLDRLVTVDDGPGAAILIRPAADDRFRLGVPEAMRAAVLARRDVTAFTGERVDRAAVDRAVAAALTAPTLHGIVPWRFALVESTATRIRLCDAMFEAWAADLRADGLAEREIADRVARGDVLRQAPLLIVPCLLTAEPGGLGDGRRTAADRTPLLLAIGAAIENLLISLAADGIGSRWPAQWFVRPDAVRPALDLPTDWDPVGVIAVGHPAEPPPDHATRAASDHIVRR
jgi:coenzyme F420-0:L-glutamate ligase / coenzyme F420-1:gamma-L-glutamate ligase